MLRVTLALSAACEQEKASASSLIFCCSLCWRLAKAGQRLMRPTFVVQLARLRFVLIASGSIHGVFSNLSPSLTLAEIRRSFSYIINVSDCVHERSERPLSYLTETRVAFLAVDLVANRLCTLHARVGARSRTFRPRGARGHFSGGFRRLSFLLDFRLSPSRFSPVRAA